MISFKLILLILTINAVPPLLAFLFPDFISQPLDFGLKLWDGSPVFGKHKTVRGFFGAIIAGILIGSLMGFSFLIAFFVGLFTMLGDLVSSFIKRRFTFPEGKDILILDQCFEGGFPLLLFHYVYSLSWVRIIGCFLIILAIAQGGSILFGRLSSPSKKRSLRLVRSSSRFREWRSCHTALSPLARYLNFENILVYHLIMENIFKIIGVYGQGVKNALDVGLKRVCITFSDLPTSFDPLNILFMSDLHIDGLDGLCERLIDLVSPLDVDVCFLGGDYRMEMYGAFYKVANRLNKLVKQINAKDGVFGILGNHDCLEVTPELEDAGICMLINDSFPLERNGEKIWIVGVDDPHYYRCHNMEKAYRGISRDAFSILLAHSPEIIKDANGYPVRLCLCGHTHGGQIRVPGIGPVFTHARVPRRFVSGIWRHNSIVGYTTRGAGSSGVPVRFNCPPEVVLITLRKR